MAATMTGQMRAIMMSETIDTSGVYRSECAPARKQVVAWLKPAATALMIFTIRPAIAG